MALKRAKCSCCGQEKIVDDRNVTEVCQECGERFEVKNSLVKSESKKSVNISSVLRKIGSITWLVLSCIGTIILTIVTVGFILDFLDTKKK